MDLSPPHGFTVNNSFTKAAYRDVYQTIDPKRPELSKKGKVILITGASRGIGKDGLAKAFALAGATTIIITARDISSLDGTESLIREANSSVQVLRIAVELTDEASVKAAFELVAKENLTIDVLVNNAGLFGSSGQFLAAGDLAKWWNDFEVNVKGTFLVTRSFLSQIKSDQSPSVIYLSSGAGLVTIPGSSAYSITKLVDLRLAAFTAAENPDIFVAALHPGIVPTQMTSGFFSPYAKDTPILAGAAVNWLTSEEAGFLRGRYISCNWDVAELITRKEEIVADNLLTIQLAGTTGQVAELRG